MADKKWVAISYCFAFLSVYLLFISYSAFSGYVEQEFNKEMPKTKTINNTTSAMSSMTSWSGMLAVIAIVAVVLVIITVINSFGSMGKAM